MAQRVGAGLSWVSGGHSWAAQDAQEDFSIQEAAAKKGLLSQTQAVQGWPEYGQIRGRPRFVGLLSSRGPTRISQGFCRPCGKVVSVGG